ncbi:sensor histidine kinase [Tenggerimyces flavus]|uniref:histidine kinase n=1 Tax=Tenggerimyces flavus TaxID=1708749 RepID=A0ABV7YPT3_9ACTN|nr:sensor histidine kinase [Tenggerimyces flavus]MBM7786476.1 signal transduction histidine kinase [Tenggerimyces flavus]
MSRRVSGFLITLAVLAWIAVATMAGSYPKVVASLGILVGASFLAAGLIAWRSRPRNRTGLLMVVVGLAWLPQRLQDNDLPFQAQVVMLALGGVWAASLAHLVLAFPTGRLGNPPARVLVVLAYAYALALGVSNCVLEAIRSEDALGNEPVPIRAVLDNQNVAIAGLGAAVIALLVVRWWRTTPAQRRSAMPVLVASAVAVALFVIAKPAEDAEVYEDAVHIALLLAVAAVPLAYLAILLQRRFHRAGVADLVVQLSGSTMLDSLQGALSTALKDETLQVGYWLPEQERYVDAEGKPIPLPPGPNRVMTKVDRNGSSVAVLVHDPSLRDEPELVEAACAAAALALDNERLTADLRARLRQLAASRTKVLQAAESERRRLERDLHDGVQQRLLSVAMTLGLAESTMATDPSLGRPLVGEAKDAVLAALDDLRAVCQGVHPPILTERGLVGAVQELTATASVPVALTLDVTGELPPELESTAYYVLAESLANITKHARANSAEVSVTHSERTLTVAVSDDGVGGADPANGTGLAGMAGRVEAIGGVLRVTSLVGQGTQIVAELPCAS